ncbi:MAG: polyketide cyclase [Leptospirales bacterium]|nr:polyketide cyclase [Leptospirales bacterium]
MWSKSFSKKVSSVRVQDLWKVWSDVNQWHTWQTDLDFARLEGPFVAGNSFLLRPKGGPEIKIQLLSVQENREFTDLTRFPLARMYGAHEFLEQDGELEIKTTISIEGPLAFLWRKLVAEDVANSLPAQTEALVDRVRNG